MQELIVHSSKGDSSPVELAEEIMRLETLLIEERARLNALQGEFHGFKSRYTQIVGGRLAELAEIEKAIKEAEQRFVGQEDHVSEDELNEDDSRDVQLVKTPLRKLFWSVARMFHPDHAKSDREAQRRHAIMAEASRAYEEGDAESLSSMLGDEEFRLYCVSVRDESDEEEGEDIQTTKLGLKDELRTVEFGIKRIK